MSNKEVITASNCRQLDTIAEPLAEIYKVAFGGAPWFEVSKCIKDECTIGFCNLQGGDKCPGCASKLEDAYDTESLIEAWKTIIKDENAMMEIEKEGDAPIRATIARPTTPEELFKRKYIDNQAMEQWLKENTPPRFVWIEDTFADRRIRPTGNLKSRGATLAAVAIAYDGMEIYTRTIAPQIIAATLRDLPATKVFVGSENNDVISKIIMSRQPERNNAVTIPDRRTLLAINGLRQQS